MIISILIYLVSLLLGMFAQLLSSIVGLLPQAFTDAIAQMVNGGAVLNSLLPMYPHPEMTGLAAETGIMPLFGWLTLLLGVVVTLMIIFKVFKLFLRLWPGNTEGYKNASDD